ncbi:hypothetical protein CYMTET_44105 [Cymbomonas tetramitiformis]|uniref:Uncharacterized protein n=1 Tax=Cymbomonas tetramitiformis TaxID=36881 RepID=A0AAE0C2X9_9CHLO|nr:hypothetical protein CYMTET_44105 [Cymbomonas tetramitiformis]
MAPQVTDLDARSERKPLCKISAQSGKTELEALRRHLHMPHLPARQVSAGSLGGLLQGRLACPDGQAIGGTEGTPAGARRPAEAVPWRERAERGLGGCAGKEGKEELRGPVWGVRTRLAGHEGTTSDVDGGESYGPPARMPRAITSEAPQLANELPESGSSQILKSPPTRSMLLSSLCNLASAGPAVWVNLG